MRGESEMGQITICISGNLIPTYELEVTANGIPHANAISQTIEFLARVVLPRAIEQDKLRKLVRKRDNGSDRGSA